MPSLGKQSNWSHRKEDPVVGNGKEFVGVMWENVRIRMHEVGKGKDIQWGEGLGVFAQSMRPAGEKTKCLEILGRQGLRLPQGSGVSLLGMSTCQQHLDSAHWLCSRESPCLSHSRSGPQSPYLEKEVCTQLSLRTSDLHVSMPTDRMTPYLKKF